VRRARGDRNERRTSESRNADIERSVRRGSAASHIVIVHARQVIVHKRIGVDHLECGGNPRCVTLTAGSIVCRQNQDPAQPLASAEESVFDRLG
jgi:hypothetical protein